MMFLRVATLVFVTFFAVQIPRDAQSKSANGVESNGDANQSPAAKSPSLVPQQASQENTKQGGNVTPASKEHAVQITSIPKVSIESKKDGYDKTLVVATGLLVVIGGLQIFYLWRTVKTMKSQFALTQPRLHVDGVRVVGFKEEEQKAIFFVKIVNSGLVAAENVSVSIRIDLASHVYQYPRSQIMLIPANGSRECFIRSAATMHNYILSGFEEGGLLRISGHVTWNNKRIEYCYKYNPWGLASPRPPEFPLFVPCDFDTDISVGFSMTGGMNRMSAVLEARHIKKVEMEPNDPPKE